MRSILFDELPPDDGNKIRLYLSQNLVLSTFETLFWLDLPESLYSELQKAHTDCRPFSFAIELTESTLTAELLLRSRNHLHCTCMSYATAAQREFLLEFLDTLSHTCSLSS